MTASALRGRPVVAAEAGEPEGVDVGESGAATVP
jgi:hypothetical protein